jgi:hypothetical protein
MSTSGAPSIAATSGFVVSANQVEGQKHGLVFYGLSGANAAPWQPGSTSFLCVKSPTQRTQAQVSGGTPNGCDGVLSVDFLDYVATHPTALGVPLNAGASIWAQAWFRDPPAPGTTNLSDGVRWTMCP